MGEKVKISALDMPDVPMGKLPEHLELQRTRVSCKLDAPTHTDGVDYSGAYAAMGVDNSLRIDEFCNNFRIIVNKLNEDEMEFDMVGIDAAFANAFRRILIAEVPTMAFDKILVAQNTSVIGDEILAHRLGLLPIQADPRFFEYLSETDDRNERNTIVFKLHVKCERGSPRLTVKSGQMKWLPNGSELISSVVANEKPKTFTSFSCSQSTLTGLSENPPRMKHDDITIARLGPGQEIELEAHAFKGNGKTHAKWSPVATAWYKMLPEVVLLKEIKNEEAEKLVARCKVKPNIFDIEDIGNGEKRVKVSNPRNCTLCRECIRHGGEDMVELRRVRDHFIFTIESSGALPPEDLFTEAIKILEEKCDRVISELS